MEDEIRKYFIDRPAISISSFKKEAGIPARRLENFVFNRADKRRIQLYKIVDLIQQYSPGWFKGKCE